METIVPERIWSSPQSSKRAKKYKGHPYPNNYAKTQTLLYIPVRERLCLERREVEKRIYGFGKVAAHGFRRLYWL